MFYSVHRYRGRKGEPKGTGWRDLRDLLVRGHVQLGDPIVLVWDNLRMHLVEPLREFIAAHDDWLTGFQLPSYAPDVNPQERHLVTGQARHWQPRRSRPQRQITRTIKSRLKQIHFHPNLVDGYLAATGLIMDDLPTSRIQVH